MFRAIFSAKQHADNLKAQMSAARATSDAREAKNEVEQIKAEVEKIAVIAEALWTLLKEKLNCTDDELLKKVQEIEAQNKIPEDNAAKHPPVKCDKCGRMTAANRPVCLYCGGPIKQDVFIR